MYILFLTLFIFLSKSQSCNENQYLTKDNKCEDCKNHCSSCFDEKTCQRCEDGYELGMLKEEEIGCMQCPVGCDLCTLGMCTKCNIKYNFVDGVCEEIYDNSKTVILILGVIAAVVVVIISLDVFISYIYKNFISKKKE